MKSGCLYYLLILIIPAFSCSHQSKTGYVSLAEVYEKFPMTKETENKMENIKNLRKSMEDSMVWKLNKISTDLNKNPSAERMKNFQEEKQAYSEKKDFFERDSKNAELQMSQQVWKQINQYVKDFGEENGYDYILGADGTGTLMYANKDNDITKEVSEYVNKRYEGRKK